MTEIKPGDRVRVEYEGVVRELHAGDTAAWVTCLDGANPVPLSALTVITPPMPPEPAIGSVVLDAQGDVWQRRANGWHSSVFPFGGTTWCVVCGPGTPTLLVPQD